MRLDVGQGSRQHAVRLPAVAAHRGDHQLGQLPAVQLAHLGCGHLQLLAQTAQQTAHHLTLGLERAGLRQVQDDAGDAYRDFGGHLSSFLTN